MRGIHRVLRPARAWTVRQLVTGLVAIPLSAVPLVGYMNLTPEGRLVRDKAIVAISPPSLPQLNQRLAHAMAAGAPRYTGAVMALAYHGIGTSADGEGGFVISARRFGEHLATLKVAGMHAVTATDVARSFTGGPELPPNAVMISFDDGRTDAMMFADPLLEQARMKATMFVITSRASEHGVYYTPWDKLESYAASGRWDLQAHTADLHRQRRTDGGTLPALTSLERGETLAQYRARVRADLAEASNALEAHVGRRPSAFAYPFGAYGAERANDPGIRQVLREEVGRRFAVAFHQDDQRTIPLATAADDLLGLRRLEVGNWSGAELLRRIAAAAGRTAHEEPVAGPGAEHPGGLVGVPVAPPAIGPGFVVPEPVPGVGSLAAGPAPALRRPAPATTPARRLPTPASPAPAPPGGPAPTPTAPVAPAAPAPAAPTTTPAPTTPPTTAPAPATTTTTAPGPVTTTTTTTAPPTTTTTDNGCRSRGQGNVCRPGG